MPHAEPTTLGLTVDPRPRIDLTRPPRRTPDGAGVLVYGPILGTLLLCVLALVGRALWRWLA